MDLLAKTIEQWSRPIPEAYLSQPLVLVGPSAVGKGRLLAALLADYGKFFQKVVTHTTRRPRPDEVNGTSYHFTPNATFHSLVPSGYFLEWAMVHGNSYGALLLWCLCVVVVVVVAVLLLLLW